MYEYEFFEVIGALKLQPALLDNLNIIGEIPVDQVILVAKERPEFLTMYDFNTENLTEDQIMDLIKVGNQEFIESMSVDLTNLSTYERFKIIKASKFNEGTMRSVGAFKEDFDNPYYIREIIKNTGGKFLNILKLDCLSPSDWVKILKHHRHLYGYVNLEDVLNGDIYYLIQMCMIVPEMLKHITEDNSHKISSRGWELLLVKYGNNDDDRLIKMCDFSKLEQRSWGYIQREKPELLLHKL